MSRRLKVLISAYACEPDKGSEPEVGWQWALQMARFHDVTVVTRANNRANIERRLATLPPQQPAPGFVYHDETQFVQGLKRRVTSQKLYYIFWQQSARAVIAKLHAERNFDLLHHVTFAGFRYPTAVWGHGAPCVWGPVGGIESVPWSLLPWRHPKSLFGELARNAHNSLQLSPWNDLPKRAAASTVILASTPEMVAAFERHGFSATLMPTIGLKTRELPFTPHRPGAGPLRLLFVGNLITLKGIDLALHALHQSGSTATLTFIGDGNYRSRAKALTRALGLESRVTFAGRLPREEVLRRYADFDVFLFPGLHDTGGYAVIEAMFNALPVICLDTGGPAVAVRADCGIKVPLAPKRTVIAALAAAIKRYDHDRELAAAHGQAARACILQNYDWDQKGEQMKEVYEKTVQPSSRTNPKLYAGFSLTERMMQLLVSFKGLAATILLLLLVGLGGFLTLSHLSRVANRITDHTLPGILLVGQANLYLADINRSFQFIVAETPEQRTKLRQEIDSLSDRTSGYLANYEQLIDVADRRHRYNDLINARTRYMQIRDQVLTLAVQGQRETAIKEFTAQVLPAQLRVKDCADALLSFDVAVAEYHSQQIKTAGLITKVAFAFIGLVVFVLGFIFGLFR